jgi:hypothetical protein
VIRMPAPIVISAAIAGATIFGFVLLFFRVPRSTLSGMKRLYLSWLGGILVWLACLAYQLPDWRALPRGTKPDLICGALVLCCFIWSSYWFANLGGGFRVLMLLDLAEVGRPITLGEWMDLYGKQRGMREFLADRLRSILVPLGLVDLEGDRVILTRGRGRPLARLLGVLALLLLKRPR